MNPEKIEKLKFLQTNRSFLGREFLTWLWYWLETRNHVVDLPGQDPFHLYIDDKIVLSSASGPVREHSMRGGTPAIATEAKTALRAGKLVTEASFIMKQSNLQWTWSLKSDDFCLRNIKLPLVSAEEADSYLHRRLSHLDLLTELQSHLYATFLKLRFSRGFRQISNDMAHWAELA
jgi:hypothetical protein